MSFLDAIFARLQATGNKPVLQEVRDGRLVAATGGQLMAHVRAARTWLAHAGLQNGDRCALLAPNSIRWAALDLALMAEGIIVVPLYARQAPAELVGMMKDAAVSLVLCGDDALREALARCWPEAPPIRLLDDALKGDSEATDPGLKPQRLADSDPVTIIYTSGTSGEPKGVVLTAGNVNHMLGCTTARLDQLMLPGGSPAAEPEQVFHYAPFCFAASWMLLLSCLSRHAVLSLSTDLSKLADEIKLVSPHYFLNVPALLERVKSSTERQISKRGGVGGGIFNGAMRAAVTGRDRAAPDRAATARERGASSTTVGDPLGPPLPDGRGSVTRVALLDRLCLAIARRAIFPAIRKQVGPRLLALICGSAPLALETQLFFEALGIPVLQAYGLTETTAICTLDEPGNVTPGRVGPAVPGVEMRVDENGEILVRGPNIFAGYWRRPEQTAAAFRDGWFLTGDQGEADAAGNWKITGRTKNLIVLNSGHKVPPEPLEETLRQAIPGAQQVVLVGSARSFLSAVVTGVEVQRAEVQGALDALNARSPHYKRIHAFHIEPEPFTIENGLLTANGKLKRDAIAARLAPEIDALYSAAKGKGV